MEIRIALRIVILRNNILLKLYQRDDMYSYKSVKIFFVPTLKFIPQYGEYFTHVPFLRVVTKMLIPVRLTPLLQNFVDNNYQINYVLISS